MKFAVVVFPGSNCDHDAHHALAGVLGQQAHLVWHKDTGLGGADAVVLPGGFSYGDYLRCGAIARFSPIMEKVREHAALGGLVLGICNGFQILQEAGMLPGVMLRNSGLKFVCEHVYVTVERSDTPFTRACEPQRVLRMPISHNEGNFFVDEEGFRRLQSGGQVLFRYSDQSGSVDASTNPNGSIGNIAGIVNRQGNVMALMPHPERASEEILGESSGKLIFESLIASGRM